MNEKDKTLLDRIKHKAKNNPIWVAIILIFLLSTYSAKFIKAMKEIWSILPHPDPTLKELKINVINDSQESIDSIRIIAVDIGEQTTDTSGIVVFLVDPKRNTVLIKWEDLKNRFWPGEETFFMQEENNEQTIRLSE